MITHSELSLFNLMPKLKNDWLHAASISFKECRNNDSTLATLLIDGLFVQHNERLLSPEDLQDNSLDDILSSCINALQNPNEMYPFQFRECNRNRIIAYFNNLNLHPDLREIITTLESYKISLALYHVFINSPHNNFYDQKMVDAAPEEAEGILEDKRALEREILDRIKLNPFLVNVDYVLLVGP